MQWKSMKRWGALIHRMITKQQVKNEWIKRKQTCVYFVSVWIPRKQVQDHLEEFLGNNNINDKNISWKSHQSQAFKGQRLAIVDHWPALICSADGTMCCCEASIISNKKPEGPVTFPFFIWHMD